MRGIKILGTGSYTPGKAVTNDDLSEFMDTNNEWIETRTGISTRYYSVDTPNHRMASEAAKVAIADAGVSPEEIDLIIVSTCTAEFYYPNMACLVQKAIGAVNAAAFDVNTACTGFISAVDIASRYLQDDDYKKILIVSSERLSTHADFTDRSASILFGDGAAAAVIEKNDKPLYSYLSAKGDYFEALYCYINKEYNCPFTKENEEINTILDTEAKKNYLQMDGKGVYKFAVDAMTTAVTRVLEKSGLTMDDIDLVIPHQANIRIIQSATKALGVNPEKVYVNIKEHANTSSACIPTCLAEIKKEGKLKEGMKICLVGFGAGLTSGAIIFEQ